MAAYQFSHKNLPIWNWAEELFIFKHLISFGSADKVVLAKTINGMSCPADSDGVVGKQDVWMVVFFVGNPCNGIYKRSGLPIVGKGEFAFDCVILCCIPAAINHIHETLNFGIAECFDAAFAGFAVFAGEVGHGCSNSFFIGAMVGVCFVKLQLITTILRFTHA